jgi:hypothetical protein
MKQFHVFVGIDMKELLEKALELAKAGYWDAAIDLLEEVISSLETRS